METKFWFASSLVLANRIDHAFFILLDRFLLTQGIKPEECEKPMSV